MESHQGSPENGVQGGVGMYAMETDEGSELERGVVPIRWVPTDKMLADAMTKMCDPAALIDALRRGEIHVPHQ